MTDAAAGEGATGAALAEVVQKLSELDRTVSSMAETSLGERDEKRILDLADSKFESDMDRWARGLTPTSAFLKAVADLDPPPRDPSMARAVVRAAQKLDEESNLSELADLRRRALRSRASPTLQFLAAMVKEVEPGLEDLGGT